MTSGIAFDRHDRLRAFPYDRFKIYTIVPIVRIEFFPSDRGRLSGPGRFAVVWVAFPYGRPDRLNIFWDDPDDPDDHMETRLKIKIRKRTLFDAFSGLLSALNARKRWWNDSTFAFF